MEVATVTPAIFHHGFGAACGAGVFAVLLLMIYGQERLDRRDPLLIIYPIGIGGILGWFFWQWAMGLFAFTIAITIIIYVVGTILWLAVLNRALEDSGD